MLSQAAANILIVSGASIIASSQYDNDLLLCETQLVDTLYVHNSGTGILVISRVAFANGNKGYVLLAPGFPAVIAPGDSIPLIIAFIPPSAGVWQNTLSLFNNDTITGHNPVEHILHRTERQRRICCRYAAGRKSWDAVSWRFRYH